MDALKQQVVNQELEYKTLKRIKPSSIKNEMRKHMNSLLRKTSDEFIDLLEQMLCKNMGQRIDILGIYDHPWIVKYKRKDEIDSEEKEKVSGSSSNSEASLDLDDVEAVDIAKAMSDSSSADGQNSQNS
jgi:serine/threonine protein kinase